MVEVELTRYERNAMLAVRWENFPEILPLLSDLAGSGPIVIRDATDQVAVVGALGAAADLIPPAWSIAGPGPRCCVDPTSASDRLRYLATRVAALTL